VVDCRNERWPPHAGLEAVGPVGADELNQPCGSDRGDGMAGVGLGGDRWGEVPGDPPPHRGGGMIIGQRRTGGDGRTEQLPGVDAGAGERRQPISEHWGERITG
jgi:hypothetical protein